PAVGDEHLPVRPRAATARGGLQRGAAGVAHPHRRCARRRRPARPATPRHRGLRRPATDRKSTRLNSSHVSISYAVFRLKKNKIIASKVMESYQFLPSQKRCRLVVKSGHLARVCQTRVLQPAYWLLRQSATGLLAPCCLS